MSKEPQMLFEVDCPCGKHLVFGMPWVNHPNNLEFHCAECTATYYIHTVQPYERSEDK